LGGAGRQSAVRDGQAGWAARSIRIHLLCVCWAVEDEAANVVTRNGRLANLTATFLHSDLPGGAGENRSTQHRGAIKFRYTRWAALAGQSLQLETDGAQLLRALLGSGTADAVRATRIVGIDCHGSLWARRTSDVAALRIGVASTRGAADFINHIAIRAERIT
jgi:hypothetical protein